MRTAPNIRARSQASDHHLTTPRLRREAVLAPAGYVRVRAEPALSGPTTRQRADYARRATRVGFAEAWSASFVQDKYGAATTHWRKLEDRVHRGVGNPCPLVLIGLSESIVTFGEDPNEVRTLIEEAQADYSAD